MFVTANGFPLCTIIGKSGDDHINVMQTGESYTMEVNKEPVQTWHWAETLDTAPTTFKPDEMTRCPGGHVAFNFINKATPPYD